MREKLNPVRKIKASYTSLRGVTSSNKNETGNSFESALERDYLLLLEFDHLVDEYVEQPVEIYFEDKGQNRHYTPDVLVYYRKDIEVADKYSPLLVEIKYRKNLWEDWKILKPKFSAAQKYATSKGWRFKILTEKEIRTPYLDNVKFLLPFKKKGIGDSNNAYLLNECLEKLEISSPDELILAAARDRYKQAELLHELWVLIAIGDISCDLTIPLTMKSEIWLH